MGLKILIVDDSRTVRSMQRSTLNMLGHTDVIEAADGLKALASVSKDRPDLMLVDWTLPKMDGITLIRKIRETDDKLPIIMVTSESEKSRVLEALKAGVNNFVVKPFTAETLAEKIRQTMAKCAVVAGTDGAPAHAPN